MKGKKRTASVSDCSMILDGTSLSSISLYGCGILALETTLQTLLILIDPTTAVQVIFSITEHCKNEIIIPL